MVGVVVSAGVPLVGVVVFGRVVVIGLEGVPIGLVSLDWGCGCWTSGCGIVPIGRGGTTCITKC